MTKADDDEDGRELEGSCRWVRVSWMQGLRWIEEYVLYARAGVFLLSEFYVLLNSIAATEEYCTI